MDGADAERPTETLCSCCTGRQARRASASSSLPLRLRSLSACAGSDACLSKAATLAGVSPRSGNQTAVPDDVTEAARPEGFMTVQSSVERLAYRGCNQMTALLQDGHARVP